MEAFAEGHDGIERPNLRPGKRPNRTVILPRLRSAALRWDWHLAAGQW